MIDFTFKIIEPQVPKILPRIQIEVTYMHGDGDFYEYNISEFNTDNPTDILPYLVDLLIFKNNYYKIDDNEFDIEMYKKQLSFYDMSLDNLETQYDEFLDIISDFPYDKTRNGCVKAQILCIEIFRYNLDGTIEQINYSSEGST